MTAVHDMNIDFRDQELWYHSRRLIIEVFKVTATFTDENFKITNLMRNDCVAVASNIALAFGAKEDQKKTRLTRGGSESPGGEFSVNEDQKKWACFQAALKTAVNLKHSLQHARSRGLLSYTDYQRLLKQIDTIKAKLAIGDSDHLN